MFLHEWLLRDIGVLGSSLANLPPVWPDAAFRRHQEFSALAIECSSVTMVSNDVASSKSFCKPMPSFFTVREKPMLENDRMDICHSEFGSALFLVLLSRLASASFAFLAHDSKNNASANHEGA